MTLAIYASATPISSLYYTQIALLFFFTSLLFWITKIKRVFCIRKNGIKETAILIAIIVSSAVFNLDSDVSYYLGIIVLILGAYFMTGSMDYKEFEVLLIRVFVIISLISCIITLYLNTHQNITIHLPRLTTETRRGSVSWGNFYYLYFVWDYWGRFGFVRNSACFREPGVWGVFCALVLGVKILDVKNKNTRTKIDAFQLIVLSLGVLTSFSTSAVFCFFICMILYFNKGNRINSKQLIIGVCLFVALVALSYYYKEVLFAKFRVGTSEYKAYVDRFTGVRNSMKAFLTNPVLGVGYTNYYRILQNLPLTVAFAVIMGEFGIMGLMWFLVHLISFSRMITFHIYEFVLLLSMLIIILFAQNLIFTPLFMIILLYAGTLRSRVNRCFKI